MNPLEANEFLYTAANESLYTAVEEDDLPKLTEAIDAGADTEYKSPKLLSDIVGRTYFWRNEKSTSLHVACHRGFMPIVQRLLEIDARVNATNGVSLV